MSCVQNFLFPESSALNRKIKINQKLYLLPFCSCCCSLALSNHNITSIFVRLGKVHLT